MEVGPGFHEVQSGDPCFVANLSNLTIRGSASQNNLTTISCTSNILGRSFFFHNVTDLRIENLLIINCGRSIPDNLPPNVNQTIFYFGPGQKTTFLFSYCTDLSIEGLTIGHSFGFGIVGVNLRGSADLRKITVSETDNYAHFFCSGLFITDFSCTGSGVVFLYSDEGESMQNTSLSISDSLFNNNINRVPFFIFNQLYVSVRDSQNSPIAPLTSGSALSIYVRQRNYFLNAQVSNSTFVNNNGFGSAFVIGTYNSLRDSSFKIDSCVIANNQIDGQGLGGGFIMIQNTYLDALTSFPDYPNDVHDLLQFSRTTFSNNTAYNGGAVYLHNVPQNISDYSVTFENCTFDGNSGSLGSAILSSSIQSTFQTKSVHLNLQDVIAYQNTFPDVLNSQDSTIDGSAIFAIFLVDNVTISGSSPTTGSRFYNNSPGVVLCSGGNLYLSGYIEFSDNLAFNGGALSLYDYALVFFVEGSHVKFIRNRALQNGGAIYTNSVGSGITNACSIQFYGPNTIFSPAEADTLNLDIEFLDNQADGAGNSIYAYPLYNCNYASESSVQTLSIINDESALYSAIFNFTSVVDNGARELSSIPRYLCVCNQTSFLSEFCFNRDDREVSTFPGRRFTMFVVAADFISTPVDSLMYADISKVNHTLKNGESIQQLSGAQCTEVGFTVFGPELSVATIALSSRPGGEQTKVHVTLNSCPPGFHLDADTRNCVCDEYVMEKIGRCNTTSYSIVRPENSWLGAIAHENASDAVFVSSCPINYCNSIENVDLTVDSQVCAEGRVGILCGRCNNSLSVVFGSSECRSCSNYWAFTILLYAAAGWILVVFLFVFDVTVTHGTVNGLIFYANIVSVNANIFFLNSNQGFLFIFVSLVNLELGFPLCFYNGMNEAAKVGFQFVFPLYLLLICLFIIIISRVSSKVQKLTSCSAVHVLATLLYLSYSKLLRTVIDILSYATVHSEVRKHIIWLFDGTLNYTSGVHILLFIAAVIVAICYIMPYTVILVLVQTLQKHTIKMKPMFDAYVAPFKDRFRFWFGFRILLLLVMCATFATVGTDDPTLALTIQLVLLVTFAVAQGYCRPFKSLALDLLDMFFIVNLCWMLIGTIQIFENKDNSIQRQRQLVAVLITFAFIAWVCILVYHIFLTATEIPKFKEKMTEYRDKMKSMAPTYSNFKQMKQKVRRRNVSDSPVALTNVTAADSNTPKGPTVSEVSLRQSDQSPGDSKIPPHSPPSFSELREPVLDFDY